ncbi:MAG: D-xylose transport system permease protein [Actinomycetota bacterium]|nr:D-xylose transport system permease protein [Actinomycetota bacterium]
MSGATSVPRKAREEAATGTVAEAWRGYVNKVRGGDVGSLPAVLGFVALVIFFSTQSGTFFSLLNGANLLQQAAVYVFVAMGMVFVLLLGEIDLSAGFTAGVSAAVLGVILTKHGMPWPVAVVGCVATGAVIGLAIGMIFARLRVPSFVVSLAFFLGLQGAMLGIIGDGGTIPVRDETIFAIMGRNLPVVWGWVFAGAGVALYAVLGLVQRRARRTAGLPSHPPTLMILKVVGLAVLLGGATYLLNRERSVNPVLNSLKGIPVIVPIAAVFVVGLTFVLRRTAFGRHIYAVGGNAEAARRAGINVPGIQTACFVICSAMAGCAGIVMVSRDTSVSPSTGGSSTLLLSIGAAVIGGTSLFGGKGRIIDAVIGGLVIAVISNGLPLMTSEASAQYIVTAFVLMLAAMIDAMARRRAAATGH